VDFLRLTSLSEAEPVTATGKIIWLWPEISAALSTGKKLREVWEAAQADGLQIPYPQFRVYVSRVRARQRLIARSSVDLLGVQQSGSISAPETSDPFGNVRKQRLDKGRDGFDFDPFSNPKDLIG
jgi:hypothetical protein